MPSLAELTAGTGEDTTGMHANLLKYMMRRLQGIIARSRCAAVFLNQLRRDPSNPSGNTLTTPGGRALHAWAAMRIELTATACVYDAMVGRGLRVRAMVHKNTVSETAPPRFAEIDLFEERGISRLGELLDLGVMAGVLGKTLDGYTHNGLALGHDRTSARRFLQEDRDRLRAIEAAVRANAPAIATAMEADFPEAGPERVLVA